MRVNVEFIEQNGSSEPMDNHGDLAVLVERHFEQFFDVLEGVRSNDGYENQTSRR